MNEVPGYRLPNGVYIHPGERCRLSNQQVWEIPEEDRWRFELEDEAASPGSEVVRWPIDRLSKP